MGHASLGSTAKYLHVTSQHLDGIHSPLDLLRLPQDSDAIVPQDSGVPASKDSAVPVPDDPSVAAPNGSDAVVPKDSGVAE